MERASGHSLPNLSSEHCPTVTSLFETFKQVSHAGVFLLDLDATVLDASDSACALIATSDTNDCVGKQFSEFVTPNERAAVSDNLSRLQLGAAPVNFGVSLLRSSGERIEVESSWALLPTVDNMPAGILGCVLDVSSHRDVEAAMRQSKELYKTLARMSPDATIAADAQGKVTFVSRRAVELFGCHKNDEMLGREITEFFAPGDATRVQEDLATNASTPEEGHEYQFIRRDGTRFLGELRFAIVRDESRQRHILICSLHDITERKRAAKALQESHDLLEQRVEERTRELRESEEKYRSLVESAGEAIFSVDAEGTFLFMNTTAAHAVGCEPDIAQGRTMWDLFPNEIADRQMASIRKVLETGERFEGESPTVVRGETRWYRTSIARVLRENGLPPFAILISRDITSRKATEQALTESELKYRTLAESTRDIIFSMSSEGVITYIGPQVSQYGFRPESIIGKSFLEFIHPDDRPRIIEEYHETMTTGNADIVSQFRLNAPDGKTYWLEEVGHVVRNEDGVITGETGVIRDVTERKLLEDQLIRSERLAAMGTLAGGVAHEFNNINSTVLGFAELALTRNDLDQELSDWLNRICRASKRARAITQNLLTFSRSRKPPEQSANLVHVVTDTVDLIWRQLKNDGIDLELKLQHVPDTLMDPMQIGQVILNLLLNAQHALRDCPERSIRIETGLRDKMVYASIRDTGCGISEKVIANIFQPFFTTKTGQDRSDKTENDSGSGLGLSVSQTIAENHGGRLEVSSSQGKGACFALWLPAQEGIQPVEEETEKSLEHVRGAGNILIVDDEEDTRELLSLYLKRLGYEVTVTDDGHKSLELLSGSQYDVLLVDLQMPEMNGQQLLRQTETLPHDKRPVCLVMSGRSRSAVLEECREYNVFDALVKPFDLDHVAERTLAAVSSKRRWET